MYAMINRALIQLRIQCSVDVVGNYFYYITTQNLCSNPRKSNQNVRSSSAVALHNYFFEMTQAKCEDTLVPWKKHSQH